MNLEEIQNDIFVSEDISKPENRVNLAIFALQIYEPFHIWLLRKLKIDSGCIIYPTINTEGNRPDYIIKLDNKIIGYIEVECGDDPEQIKRFKSKFENQERKVYTILGREKYNGDLSLEEIADFLKNEIINVKNAQTIVSFKHLIKLIEVSIENRSNNKRVEVSSKMLINPFVSELLFKLKKVDKAPGANRPIPGHIYYDTVGEEGFSLKVYSPKGAMKHISLLNISGGKGFVNFQSAKKYDEYLNDRNESVVHEWIDFIESKLKLRITKLEYNSRTNTTVDMVLNNIEEMSLIIMKLA